MKGRARKRTPEGEVKRAILDRLKYVPRACVLPITTSGMWDPVRKIFRTSSMRLGTPDILICLDGHFVAIEVKAPRGKTTPQQDLLLEEIRFAGGFVLVARSVEDLEKFLVSNGFAA